MIRERIIRCHDRDAAIIGEAISVGLITRYASAVTRAISSQEVSARQKNRIVVNGYARRDRAGAVRAFDLPAAYIDRTVGVVINLDEFIVGAVGSPGAEFTDDYRRKVVGKNRSDARALHDNRATDICDIDEECFRWFDVRIAINCQIE